MSRQLIGPLVPLTLAEFDFALATANAAYDGKLIMIDAVHRNADTPGTRVWWAAMRTVGGDDVARQQSVGWRLMLLRSIAKHERFRHYMRQPNDIGDALAEAVASAPLCLTMTDCEAFDCVAAELKRRAGAR